MQTRTIVSALNPMRVEGDYRVMLKVWFAELNVPVDFIASPLDCETHGKELWIRAMAGEYGPVEVVKLEKMIEHGSNSQS
jgi:hypothetical protein